MRTLVRTARLALLVAFVMVFAESRALARQILQTANDSLTTYRPSGNSTIQGVRPQVLQRGVTLDGAMRSPPGFPMVLAGDPFENAWIGGENYAGLRIDIGAYAPQDLDIALPSAGIPWVVGRTYNAGQKDSGGAAMNSNGYQGKNWFQISQPEILNYVDSDHSKDMVYLIYGADRYVEFLRVNSTSNQYKGKNGTAGIFDYQSGSPDVWVYTDQVGNQWSFFGFNTTSHTTDGQFWKVADPNGSVSYVGDSSTASTAITNGYSGGKITTAYDASDHRFTYTYTTLDSVSRLTQVKAETKTGGTWSGTPTGVATAVQVDYTYYSNESHGDIGDLKQVTITTTLNDSTGETDQQVKRKYYRYWEGSADDTASYNSSTNPGYPHALKYVYDFEGIRVYDWLDQTFDQDQLTETDANLASYAAAYFEYDSSHRVNLAYFDGQCGCGGGSNGTFHYTYATNGSYTDNSGYDQTWSKRTVVERPDTSYLTQYFDEISEGLSQVITDIDPASTSPTPKKWVTYVERDSSGRVSKVHTPENITGYTHNTSGNPDGTITTSTSAGLVNSWVRAGSGAMTGFINSWKHQQGTSGTAYFTGSQTFTSLSKTITDGTVVRPLIATMTVYTQEITSGSTGSYETDFSYTDYSSASPSQPISIASRTTTNPVVSTGNNGSGSATSFAEHFKKDGFRDFKKNEDATIEYWEYTNGQQSKYILDADTTKTGSGQDFYGVTIPSGFSSSGTPLHLVTTTTYTSQGFPLLETRPENQNMTYLSRLADHRMVVLRYADYSGSGTPTYYGPIRYSIRNQAGREEASGIVQLSAVSTTSGQDNHVDETKSDPIAALALGTVAQMRTSVFGSTGTQKQESRVYFSIPSSSPGTEGTHYDSTRFAYDDSGRRIRAKEASGTIRRNDFDLFGRVSDASIGTNDHGLAGGESSGTSNMVTTDTWTYDSGSAGLNGNLTTVARYRDGTNHDDTSYSYDYRGRQILETPALAPFTVHKYDTANREIAVGQFSSSSGLSTSTDPTSTSTNRLALSESLYDEMGRVWEELRHNITQSSGADADTLASQNWRDERGRIIKVDGNELSKTKFDRIGRVTDEYILAKDDDTTYANVFDSTNHVVDVSGDIVLEQDETRYDATTGTLLLQARIERFHSDYGTGETTGPLDTDADGLPLKLTAANLKGRPQITANWYDSLERLTDRVEYGTNGGSDFDRSGLSVPSRSDSALRTTWAFNYDGTTDTITDPRALITKRLYDAEGRTTSEIKNFNAGVNSGNPYGTDQNVTVSYGFTNGLRTSSTAMMPSSSDNQITTYIYGSTAGTPSQMKIATGHLIRAVKYPDSTNSGTTVANIDSDSSDVVSYAYDAQGREVYKKDQSGNIVETDIDGNSRSTQQRITTLASGFDGAIRRIATTYDGLGRVSEIDQYDNATVGSGTAQDGAKYTYDDWGSVSLFEEDRDSAVSGGGNQYSTSYVYAKATTGRNALRKTSMTMPSGRQIDYQYRTAGGLHDGDVSRASNVVDHAASIALASYDYKGVQTVVGTQFSEANIAWNQYGSTAGTYPDLDNFNRVVKSRWSKTLSTPVDFYHVELTYDRDSSIVSAQDQVHTGFDVVYTMDSVNRLTEAKEGTLSGGSITSTSRDEQWTLSHTGNWDYDKVDLNGDGDFVDAGELNDHRTHDKANQLNARDTNNDGTNDYTLSYDGPGDLTDDGQNYTYVYDAFLRLRQVKNRSNGNLLAEYRYNGLGHRIGIHEDTDNSGVVDSSDKWYYDAFDEEWRLLARFRESDASPKEDFIPSQAGLDGTRRSNYVDTYVCRNKDANTSWTAASDGTLEERTYICQNWRADVSAIVSSSGAMKEWDKYTAYGIPYGLPGGDTDSSGGCDSTDIANITNKLTIYPPPYDVRYDINLDGVIDSTDKSTIQSSYQGISLGRGALSSTVVNNRMGLVGSPIGPTSSLIYHIRLRTLSSYLGGWMQRDPIGAAGFGGTYEYAAGSPLVNRDPTGAISVTGRSPTWFPCQDLPVSNPSLLGCVYSTCASNACTVHNLPESGDTIIPSNRRFTATWKIHGHVAYGLGELDHHQHAAPCANNSCLYTNMGIGLDLLFKPITETAFRRVDCESHRLLDTFWYQYWHGANATCTSDDPLNPGPTWTGPGIAGTRVGTSELQLDNVIGTYIGCNAATPAQDATLHHWLATASLNAHTLEGRLLCNCGCKLHLLP